MLEDIYSSNAEKQKQAIEELKTENDFAFDEQFENDLCEWIRKATDEQKNLSLTGT